MRKASLVTAQLLSEWMREEDDDADACGRQPGVNASVIPDDFHDASMPSTDNDDTYRTGRVHKSTGTLPATTSAPPFSTFDLGQDQDAHMEDLCDEMMHFFTNDQHRHHSKQGPMDTPEDRVPEDTPHALDSPNHGLDYMSMSTSTDSTFFGDPSGPEVQRQLRCNEFVAIGCESPSSTAPISRSGTGHCLLAKSDPFVTIDLTEDDTGHTDTDDIGGGTYHTPDQGYVRPFRARQVQRRRRGTLTPGRHTKMRQTSLDGWFKR